MKLFIVGLIGMLFSWMSPVFAQATLHPVSYSTDFVTLQADDFWVEQNGQTYYETSPQTVTVHSDLPDSYPQDNYATLEVRNGNIGFTMYFKASEQKWWVYEMRGGAGNESLAGETGYFTADRTLFETALGTTFTANNVAIQSDAGKYPNVTFHFKNLRLTPNFPMIDQAKPIDDLRVLTSAPNGTRLTFSTNASGSAVVDGEDLVPGQTYFVHAQVAIQNLLKTTNVIDLRPIKVEVTVNSDAGQFEEIPYSLITEHSGGASTTVTRSFVAKARNIFKVNIYPTNNDIVDQVFENNWHEWVYPSPKCTFVNNTILVVPEYSSNSSCTDLQEAIDAIPNRTDINAQPMYTIKIEYGNYHLYSSATTPGLIIKNKGRVLIEAQSLGPGVNLLFPAGSNGMVIDNSNVSMGYIYMYGATEHGMVEIKNNAHFSTSYANYRSDTAPLFISNNAAYVGISNAEMFARTEAMVFTDSDEVRVGNNSLRGDYNASGITFVRSSGAILANRIFKTKNGAIRIIGPGNVEITSNTLHDNLLEDQGWGIVYYEPTSTSQVKIERTIFAGNTGAPDVYAKSSTDSITFQDNLFHILPDSALHFVNVPSPIGSNNNRMGDPLFGEDFCLMKNSPGFLSYPSDYMGHRGACSPIEPDPTPTPSSFIANPPGWWFLIPEPLRNFLEQLYVWVFLFRQPTGFMNLLEGLPTPSPAP